MANPSSNLEIPSALDSNASLRALLEVMPLPVALVRRDGGFLARNEQFLEVTAEPDATPRGVTIHEVFSPAECEILLSASEGDEVRSRKSRADGNRSRWLAWTSRVWPADEDLILITGVDITREAELESYIAENQWFETAAALSGGLAHDFNNALAGILGLSEIVSLRLPKDSPLQTFTTRIASSVDRAKTIVRRFSQFSRKSPGIPDAQPTGMLIDELVPLLKAFMPSNVTVSSEIDPETPWSHADRHDMEHVILNCCTFFRARLRADGGTLHITCRPAAETRVPEVRLTASGSGVAGISIESAFALDLKPSATAYESGAALFTAARIARAGNHRLHLQRDDPRTLSFVLNLPASA